MKIAFIPSGVSGVQFYRVWQPANALKKVGVETAVLWYKHGMFLAHPWEDDINDQTSVISDVNKAYEWADMVVWMQLHNSKSLELFKSVKDYYRKPTFMDMDDDIFNIQSDNIASNVYYPGSPFSAVAAEQMRLSDGLVVSTPHLAEVYKKYNKTIHVIPNTIDLNLWRVHPPRSRRSFKSKDIVIGWVGGGSHIADLKMIERPLFQIFKEWPNVKFACLHGCPPEWRRLPQVVCPMEERNGKLLPEFRAVNEYPAWVTKHRFDIGIAPLVDNDFNRAKSNLRWLEYSIQGIPTVYSPVTHFAESIDPFVTGYPAETEDQWYNALKKLIIDEAYRQSMGDSALAEVLKTWTPKQQALKYKQILQELPGVGSKEDLEAHVSSAEEV